MNPIDLFSARTLRPFARHLAALPAIALMACGGGGDAGPGVAGQSANAAPLIVQEPASLSVSAGRPARFEVAAIGAPPLTYRWQRDDADVEGATASSYTLPAASVGDNGVAYRVVVSNDAGSVNSDAARLVVVANAPALVAAPQPGGASD
jgi:hypothetical protein